MEKKPLVSVITPCHNSAPYIHRLLDSLLSQTYPNVEIFIVDNDSKDNTAEVVKSYFPKFKQKGYEALYIHEDDLGPSSAMQTGFQYIKGDYLVMPDSDDYYASPSSLEKYINRFLTLPEEYAIIRSQLQFIDESTMQPLGVVYENYPEDDPGTLFEDCLLGKNGYNYAPIDYMVKVSALREMTGMRIYNAYNVGQQRQVCLPLYYKYKAWTIPEPLACYLVRRNSISHGDYLKFKVQSHLYTLQETYINSIFDTISTMSLKERKKYHDSFMKNQAGRMVMIALKANENIVTYMSDYIGYGGSALRITWVVLKFKLNQLIRKQTYCNKCKSV